MDLQQASPIGAGSKAGLKVMPADSVALRDGHCPGERTSTRPSDRLKGLGFPMAVSADWSFGAVASVGR
jgi:hypothetical protein